METRITQLEVRQNDINVKVGVIENQVNELKQSTKEVRDAVTENKHGLQLVKNEYGHIEQAVDRIERVVIDNNRLHAQDIESIKKEVQLVQLTINKYMGGFMVLVAAVQIGVSYISKV